MSERSPFSVEALAALKSYLERLDSRTRQRGKTYFNADRVSDVVLNGPSVRGVVQGSNEYETKLLWTNGRWSGACSCPMVSNCKHVYATGLAWLTDNELRDQSTPSRAGVMFFPEKSAPPAAPSAPLLKFSPGEVPLVTEFAATTGRVPTSKELSWLRNLERVFLSLKKNDYGQRWFDLQSLQNLVPNTYRDSLYQLGYDPFVDFWKTPPATPIKLWPFIALLFQDHHVPLPDFIVAFTDVAGAEASRRAVLREKQLAAWRQRFAALDAEASAPAQAAGDAPSTLRLVLGSKKISWEVSEQGPAGPFVACSIDMLRPALNDYSSAALEYDDASNIVLSGLRKRFVHYNKASLKLTSPEDAALIGEWLAHPVTRRLVVGPAGTAFEDDPRTVTWKIDDHPSDPTQAVVSLVLSDGSPLPAGAIHLPGKPARYLHGQSVFTGLPPLELSTASTPVPREVLVLPEAGRFAARTGVKIPGGTAHRFRSESLRARVRAKLLPPGLYSSETLCLDLHAVNPEGAARARWDSAIWNTKAPKLDKSPDAAFLLHDFTPLQSAARHLAQYPNLIWARVEKSNEGFIALLGSGFGTTFSDWLAGVPAGTLVELSPELAAFAAAPTRGHFALEATESGIDWFDVSVELRVEDTTLTDEEIALLRKANGRFIRLQGKGWRRLQLDLSDADRARFERLGLDPTKLAEEDRESPRFHALQLADETLGEALPEKLWRQIRERAAAIRQVPAPALPAGLHAELRPYQLEGYHYLAHLAENRFGGVLADDMGLGKTLQALTWLLWLASLPSSKKNLPKKKSAAAPKVFRALVICPKSVVFNWETETARFAPTLTTARFTPRASGVIPTGVHLVVANYTQLRLNAEALAGESWDAVILDEGQNIKNPTSATAQAARALRSTHRLVLTGTPIENRLLDLWSLFAFAQPGLLGGQTQFKRLYNDKTDPTARSRLATRVRHFMLRRTKGQVARDLPPRSEEDIIVELDGPQRTLYDAELKRARAMLLKVETARDFDAARFNILQSLLRLRQICCDPRLLGADLAGEKPARKKKATTETDTTETAEAASKISASAKLEALLDTLEPALAEGHRVLVFSQFVTMLEIIRAELVSREIKFLMLTGQTENRQELVQQFQAADGPPVFLLSLKAAGSGLNLTAASYVVLYDPWWNPAVEAQAIDRTHRIGQTQHVIAYRLLARNTIEEKIRALQKEKAALAASVVQEESLAKVLDLDSLRQILG
ncbi:MAG: DEAD/DEAH box helicase [Lacunisphaera sp.]